MRLRIGLLTGIEAGEHLLGPEGAWQDFLPPLVRGEGRGLNSAEKKAFHLDSCSSRCMAKRIACSAHEREGRG